MIAKIFEFVILLPILVIMTIAMWIMIAKIFEFVILFPIFVIVTIAMWIMEDN